MTAWPTPQRYRLVRNAVAITLWSALAGAVQAAGASLSYAGACDASAAVALDASHFVVANDEDNILAIFRIGQPARLGAVRLDAFLGTDRETDIEGAAAVGQRIYWITSHARDSQGKARPERRRFFATELRPGAPPSLAPVHQPYTKLLDDLLAAEALAPYRLKEAAQLAAEAPGGLNIEGLAATPEGELLIGLRNPLTRDGRAIVIPLRNPAALVEHRRGERARFGAPIELDLQRRGIRSIERVGAIYLVVAGPTASAGSFALYRWSGSAGEAPQPVSGVALHDLRPEALFARPGGAPVELLSDDGGFGTAGRECKSLPMGRQSFRGLTTKP